MTKQSSMLTVIFNYSESQRALMVTPKVIHRNQPFWLIIRLIMVWLIQDCDFLTLSKTFNQEH